MMEVNIMKSMYETPVIEIEVLDVKGDILAASTESTLTAEAEGSDYVVMSW